MEKFQLQTHTVGFGFNGVNPKINKIPQKPELSDEEIIMKWTKCSHATATRVLAKHKGDIVESILELNPKYHN